MSVCTECHQYNATAGAHLGLVLKLGEFGEQFRDTETDLQFGAGEGWRKIIWTDRVRNGSVQ